MFIRSTIVKPDIQQVIYCVAIVLHDRMVIDEGGEADSGATDCEAVHLEQQFNFPFFSEDNNPLYKEPSQADLRLRRQRRQRTIPSEGFIFDTIKSIYECAHFSVECVVITLIYIERLLNTHPVKILTSTWRPIVLAAIIVSQKVFDDVSVQNADFSLYCPMFTLREINYLETKFLELLQYNVSISASTYASFYFHIQTLCREASTEERVQLNMDAAREIEARVNESHRRLATDRKWRSDNHQPFQLGRQPAVMN